MCGGTEGAVDLVVHRDMIGFVAYAFDGRSAIDRLPCDPRWSACDHVSRPAGVTLVLWLKKRWQDFERRRRCTESAALHRETIDNWTAGI
jgi:hypothetical protein